jgi:hypothetical protein
VFATGYFRTVTGGATCSAGGIDLFLASYGVTRRTGIHDRDVGNDQAGASGLRSRVRDNVM